VVSRIESRDAETIAVDKVLFAHSRQTLIRGHPLAHCHVIGSHILESLAAHALDDESLDPVDGLDERSRGQSKRLGPKFEGTGPGCRVRGLDDKGEH